jgi:hypothetical protein
MMMRAFLVGLLLAMLAGCGGGGGDEGSDACQPVVAAGTTITATAMLSFPDGSGEAMVSLTLDGDPVAAITVLPAWPGSKEPVQVTLRHSAGAPAAAHVGVNEVAWSRVVVHDVRLSCITP